MINGGKMHEVKKNRCQRRVRFIPRNTIPVRKARGSNYKNIETRKCWEEIL